MTLVAELGWFARMPGCRWKEDRQNQFSWIAPVEGKPSKVTCTACHKELSFDHGAYNLKKHEKRQPHIDSLEKKDEAEKRMFKILLVM